MTATQWLIQQLLSVGRLEIQKDDYLLKIIEQAKEIEKQQMLKALIKGSDVQGAYDIELEFKEYYNETYKNTKK
jgi:hypothetical protein